MCLFMLVAWAMLGYSLYVLHPKWMASAGVVVFFLWWGSKAYGAGLSRGQREVEGI